MRALTEAAVARRAPDGGALVSAERHAATH